MFKIITKDSKIYIGNVASPDNQVTAADYRQVGKILNQFNVISIYGHDEMILPRGHIKGWFEI
ncbi:hypothetical protein OIN60_02395 [Paenibacillus sp. P96]|uniref:Uncharacterized protein n=1 Tax=Paenibacillus zeirhizosphaerae TaxID=2987519 RepID=A0ABT9FLN0_9BACL|nr:hypothetical protein [Paenibacillus sp. P96]MDP4095642.1 hypothetical protein [Paenibacillus sp. P96]